MSLNDFIADVVRSVMLAAFSVLLTLWFMSVVLNVRHAVTALVTGRLCLFVCVWTLCVSMAVASLVRYGCNH